MRLGLPTRIIGRRGLRAWDTRRPQSAPHLSVSLAHLRDVFGYLASHQIHFYRLASELIPLSGTADVAAGWQQLAECERELEALGQLAREHMLRLSIHAPLHVQLASLDPVVVAQSAALLALLAALLDALSCDADAVIVVHCGGSRDALAAPALIGRWCAAYSRLPPVVQRRLVLEHEDDGASLGLALRIHAATGVPLVFDHLHFWLNNPERWSMAEALSVALATWPRERRPKVHFSTPRTELRAVEQLDPETGRSHWLLSPPRPGHHADFVNAWEFAAFVEAARRERDFDVMLEAKASDLALLRLRADLARYLPEVARLVDAGCSP